MSNSIWAKWDGSHDTTDQQKRIARAYSAENTPLSISVDDCTGQFQGNSGRYDTSLSECTCTDFKRRKQPCKHMYRLAIELGTYGDKSQVKSDQYARKVPKDEMSDLAIKLVGKIENYSDTEQIEIKGVLLEILFHKQQSVFFEDASVIQNALNDDVLSGTRCYSRFINKMRKKDMLQAIAEQGDELPKDRKLVKDIADWLIMHSEKYGPLLFPHCMEIRPSPELSLISLTIYKYLHRKFDESAHTEYIFDPESCEEIKVEKGFPDDLATGLLNMFGTNPLDK